MDVAVCLFTSDLRVHDQPVLRAAVRAATRVVPLFVVDQGVAAAGFVTANRAAFLAAALADLDSSLRSRGGRLILRTGDVVAETCRVAAECGAGEVHLAAGVSGYAARRERRLADRLAAEGRRLVVHDAVITAVPPGAVVPSGGSRPGSGKDHFAVFTPYFRRWWAEGTRPVVAAPRTVAVPEGVRSAALPTGAELCPGGRPSPALPEGGEAAGRRRFASWRRTGLAAYEDRHDDLPGDATSRLSPYLHFGCVSPVELVRTAADRDDAGAYAFVRQLAWRDFHHQVLAARPAAAWREYRTRGDRWRGDGVEAAAWRAGRTGYPVVDAGLRQLRHEGWMHNRARLLAASFLTKTLYVDWRVGARHFLDLLVDGDLADNQLNWQWAAGTGTDTRPNRVLNPVVQGRRFDPDGAYVRRWVPELADLPGAAVHRPWRLDGRERAALDYPAPVVELDAGTARFRRARGLD
ncbi:cryptochrome/photolyase family protein [Streptomyces catenulae]|uniref:Deoxyribodipyrimidine photo-lyase n=1 Tax=Streptomyces catenulae TaxID=66875 RepID=A0ABV2Z9Q0_9ACTN|nr:deoxyribodipyrimidine photo-lyase [Streptomyces catenulae]